MTRQSIVRMTSGGFLLGGALLAAWPLIAPWGSFAGAARGESTRWMIAHACHYLAALCLLLGILGLAVQRLPTAGRGESVAQLGFVFAMWVWGGTGAITWKIWPIISRNAGAMVEPTGVMFKPHSELLQTAAVPILAVGIGGLLFTMWKARLLPLVALVVGVVGAAMFLLAPDPVGRFPWIVFPAAGLLSGVGLVWLGWSLRRGAAPAAGS